jgi:hypothetical protein
VRSVSEETVGVAASLLCGIGHAMPSSCPAGLSSGPTYGVHPVINADYGPPWTAMATGTLTSNTSVGATMLSVTLGSGSLNRQGLRRAKPGIKVSRKHRQNENGNSPRSTSSNPSPERIDEMFRGESPLVDEHSDFKEISYGS